MKEFLFVLPLLCCPCYFATAHASKRVEKNIYQPHGPMMCRQLCEDSSNPFLYVKEDLSCRRMFVNNANDSKQHSAGVSFTCLKENMVITDMSKRRHQRTEHDWDCEDWGKSKKLLNVMDNSKHNYTRDLHQACLDGDLCLVKFIVSKRLTDINCRDENGRTPVMTAVKNGQNAVFEYLVQMGCNLTARNNRYNNLLHVACAGGYVSLVSKLIATLTYDIDSKGWRGWTPVMFASCFGHIKVIDVLVKQGCDTSTVDEHNDNMLHIACVHGKISSVKYILTNNMVSIDSRGKLGRTPVMIAAFFGFVSLLDLLVSKNCNVTATDNQGNNILHLACVARRVSTVKHILELDIVSIESRGFKSRTPVMVGRDSREIVELLVNRNCNLAATDNEKSNILHVVCASGHIHVLRYILKLDVIDINSRGKHGQTPMMFAASFGHVAIIYLLLNYNCNVSLVDHRKNNILHLACIYGRTNVVKIILKHLPVKLESRAALGRTPLMLAVLKGESKIVTLLLRRDCDATALDKHGNNILHMACLSGKVAMVKYILKLGIIRLQDRNKSGLTPEKIAEKIGKRHIVYLLRGKTHY